MSYSNTKVPHSKSSSYINLNCFNYSSDPVDSLDDIFEQKWSIKSIQISSHGANGVLFVQTNIGSFVIKMNNEAPADLFFNKFASLIDVKVPQIKIVACYEDMFPKLVFQIEKFCQKDQNLSARLRKRMDFPFYQLMEYIPSISFLQVGPNRFQKYQTSQEKLHSMGICIGFDMIINNNDRFRLAKLWGSGNEGNIANILIKVPDHFSHDRAKIKDRQDLSVNLGEYYFIDHSGFLLDIEKNKMAAQNFSKYIDKVTIFHDQIIQFLRNELPCPEHFEGLINQIHFYTKYRLSEKQLISVIEGIIYSTSMFIDFFEEKAIQQILNDLYRENTKQQSRSQVTYWDEYWNTDLAKIKLKHLQIYHLKVSTMYATYSEIIKEICQKVAKNISLSQNKPMRNPVISARNSQKNSQRPQSKQSKFSQDPIHQNIQLPHDFQSNAVVKDEEDQKLHQNFIKMQEQEKGLKEAPLKNKLKQRLERYLKKNYDQNYQRNNKQNSKSKFDSTNSLN